MSALITIGVAATAYSINEQRKAGKKQEKALGEAAEQADEAGEYQAIQLERKAGEERAVGSIEAYETDKAGKRVLSRAKAVGAASGAGGYDLSELEVEREMGVLRSLYNSELSARDLEIGAEVARREGADAARAYEASASSAKSARRGQAVANIAQTGLSLYDMYSNRTPTKGN